MSNVLQAIREDDFIEYYLFPKVNPELNSEDKVIKNLLNEINDVVYSYTKDYIWHRDPFKVSFRGRNFSNLLPDFDNNKSSSEDLPPHFYGITHFGENINDEWFLVSLVFELTRRITGLIVRVVDSDGEFILIEAADHLPQWANPESCEQRVYISEGSVHLIRNDNENANDQLSINEALESLRNDSLQSYKISSEMEKCINERIKDFPHNISEGLHRATVYVPVGVAELLKQKPSLISAAVLSFCNRDPIDMKVCRAMRYFPPENRVYTSVVFTKCLYAMLFHSNYLPDRRTGWDLPLNNSPQYKSHLLGVKLACGFEILASQASSATSSTNRATDKGWLNYLEHLKKKGYFQENVEGSRDHTILLENAQKFYEENEESMKFTPKIGEEVLTLLKQSDNNVEFFKKLERDLPKGDDDSWLNISPEELDEMLTKRYGVKTVFATNGNTNASNFSGMVAEFLEQSSEYDGIVPQPVRPKRNKDINKKDEEMVVDSSKGNDTIDFDPDTFSTQVKNLLDFFIPEDKWDSNSDMSDYDYEEDDLDKNIEDITKQKEIPSSSQQIDIKKYMEQMDRELSNTTIGKSFEVKTNGSKEPDDFDDIEDFTPVDIDVNTLKNMMKSYESQIGGPGPVSNLLSSMNIRIEEDPKISKIQTDV